ncbi:MAG: hypothetical protein HRT46_06205 [Deltaproteobacteria bacterium]|nr:hypothetical protein [Deltaproteobacteria bacterium]
MLLKLILLAFFLVSLFEAACYLLLRYEDADITPRRDPLPAASLLAAFAAECVVTLLSLLTRPFGLLGGKLSSGSGRPVLLIHGWGQNRASMALLAARLRRDGRATQSINYPSVSESMEIKAAVVASALRSAAALSDDGLVDVVAHSQGGVLIRDAAARQQCSAILGNVITLGSPHQGTGLAAVVPFKSATQMKRGSRYLERLAAAEEELAWTHFVSIASTFDAIVFPRECSDYPPGMNVTVNAIGHNSLLVAGGVYEVVKENLSYSPAAVNPTGHDKK